LEKHDLGYIWNYDKPPDRCIKSENIQKAQPRKFCSSSGASDFYARRSPEQRNQNDSIARRKLQRGPYMATPRFYHGLLSF